MVGDFLRTSASERGVVAQRSPIYLFAVGIAFDAPAAVAPSNL